MGQTSNCVNTLEGVQLHYQPACRPMANATKEGEIHDPDVREAMEEIEKENAPTPEPEAPKVPDVSEADPAKDQPAEEPKDEPVDKPPATDRPVEGEKWKEKRAEKVERRAEEKERQDKLEAEVKALNQRL